MLYFVFFHFFPYVFLSCFLACKKAQSSLFNLPIYILMLCGIFALGLVTPPKLALANSVESLAIPQLDLRGVKQVIAPVKKTCQSNARKVNKSESAMIPQVRTWGY
jgi:hypothetical protein